MVYFGKERFPIGAYDKLNKWNYGSFCIIRKLGLDANLLKLPYGVFTFPLFNVADLYTFYGKMIESM